MSTVRYFILRIPKPLPCIILEPMSTIRRLLADTSAPDRLFYAWQFALAQRMLQIMEERGLTQREFARLAQLTEAQVSALVHVEANPTLSMLARIQANIGADLLSWIGDDPAPATHARRTSRSRKE